jgi:hypothetical protein
MLNTQRPSGRGLRGTHTIAARARADAWRTPPPVADVPSTFPASTSRFLARLAGLDLYDPAVWPTERPGRRAAPRGGGADRARSNRIAIIAGVDGDDHRITSGLATTSSPISLHNGDGTVPLAFARLPGVESTY